MDIFGNPLLSEFTKLTGTVTIVATTTANFKSELAQLQQTLQRIFPLITDPVRLNQILDRQKEESAMFIEKIIDAEKLVNNCLKIKWHVMKWDTHSLKLKDLNNKLLRFFQLEVQADQSRDIKQTLFEVNDMCITMDRLKMDMEQINRTLSVSWRIEGGYESTERGKLGWGVPILPGGIVAFDEPLKNLKAKVLDDHCVEESAVVVVAGPGGCGKTTLTIMLCHDPEIRGKFGENIFFVTVTETPNFMVIVNDLFNPNSASQLIPFQSDEDAKHKLGNFLLEKVSGPMLLVLDDVWDDSFIEKFSVNINGCKILVTSRTAFPKYDVFEFDPLSDEDAEILFRRSAFSESKKRPKTLIAENLVNQMVKCCKKHPLTLTVVGRSLNGKDEFAWKSMLKTLSQDASVLDLNIEVRNRLERSFTTLDKELKECYLDFGLFPEDQRIPACALLDMWVHLYNHDNEGVDTFDKIVKLSHINLINLVATSSRKDSDATVNYCDQQFVTQHDLLRELSIDLSNKPEVPIAQRKRLIINARGEDLPEEVLQVQEPMQACILSISTGVSFSSRWGNMKVPEAEVMVLNIKSKTYTLPHFMEEMKKLKVLNVTNYGLYLTDIKNFNLLGCLSNLSRIRLERVSIPSLSESILTLENLQKVSFIMCKIANAFETELSSESLKVWPSLVELEMDYCQDLKIFPGLLCCSDHLKTLNITNCNEMCEIAEEFGNLTNLENLSLQSCTNLKKLPESITKLQKLSILDISYCLILSELPAEMGKLGGLRTVYMNGCTGINKLPPSVEKLSNTKVLCSEEWEFSNVETDLVETDMVKERGKLGWRVPILPGEILVFNEPLQNLKDKVLDDHCVDESAVVLVAAPGGFGKTTLTIMLCHNSEIRAKYGENIFYVTVPEKPDFMVMVDDLLNPKHLSRVPKVQSNGEANYMLEKILREQVARGPILLVLDGVQADLFIKNFEFKIKGYKILATSKMSFRKYDVFELDRLSNEAAMDLFNLSAFGTRNYSSTIDDGLVNQMVKCCKNHPLTLSVVGGSLDGKSEFVWKSVIKTLSQGEWVIDDKDVRKRLETTIEQLDDEFKNRLLAFDDLDKELKQCLLDLGLFPRDHIIPACALLDLWTNLYDHDDMGRDTLIKMFQLADRKFVSSITIGEEANAVVNYCEQTFATQQDWQRELAIHVSSKEPISERTRLIIDAQGNDQPASIRQLKDVKARILSITTGESFSSRWCNMNVPEVEVMVLNIMSETRYLPQLLETMHRLKVLNVTNYGLHPIKFVNGHLLDSLSSLTRIRLKRVVLSLLSASIQALVNLQKLSFIMCKTDNSFEKRSSGNPDVWPRLVEIEIDDCQDLVGFPELFCNSVHLKKLSITNCNEMIQISEALGKLTSLETLSLRSCIKLEKLPDSIIRLKKLSVLDISDCLSLSNLPENIGELGGLQMIYMKGCTGIHELPPSVEDLSQPHVLCNEEISYKWREFPNVKIPDVEEDRLLLMPVHVLWCSGH